MKAITLALLMMCSSRIAAETRTFTLTVNESQTVQMFGITAAWPVDATIINVSAQQSGVTISGRAAGRTTLIVTGVTGEHAFAVIVKPRAGADASAAVGGSAHRGSTTTEVRYSSAAREIQSSIATTSGTAARRTETQVRVAHQADPVGDRAKTSIAAATVRTFRGARELTFLDRDVDHSPLTVTGTPLRGVHYLDDHWRLHAGYTAYATYRSFLLPVDRELVAGGGYRFRTGTRSALTPGIFAIRGDGTIASLLYDYSDPDRLVIRGELGYSRGLGGAGELAFDDVNDRIRASVRYRPDGFASAGTTPHGFFGDAAWTRDYARGSSFSASASATAAAGSRVMVGSADIDHRVNDALSLVTGATWSALGASQTITIPAGARLDFARGGINALYRYSRSATNRGGHGFRLAARGTIGRFHASAYADRQQNAPTLAVVFSERPDLALALAELGIAANTPDDIARALREHAALAELGFIDGVTVQLTPERTQLGFETSWLSARANRQQIRARLVHNVVEGIASRTATTIGTLSYSQRLTASTDVFASWTYWRVQGRGAGTFVQPIAELGIRQQFTGVPSLSGGGNISGVVFADENLDGISDGTGVAAEVQLDGSVTARTTTDGKFVFRGVSRGSHRVTARVPDAPDAYFTTASRFEASPGDKLAFGVARTQARLLGSVTGDDGRGIAGVRLTLARGTKRITAETASDGAFAVSAPPGEWDVSLVRESVPAGYALVGTDTRAILLSRTEPSRLAHVLRAHRSIGGKTTPFATVHVRPIGKSVRADEHGQFVIRSLPAGALTVVSAGVERQIELPSGPAALELELTAATTVAASSSRITTPRSGATTFVNLGVYRVESNANVTAARARAAGVKVILGASGPLTIVRAGPFASRDAATAAAQRLTRAGLEAIVASR